MSRADLPEADWREFKKLREVALEILCERIVGGIGKIASDKNRSFHARYLNMHEFIQEQDHQIARAFNSSRRSNAIQQLAVMMSLDLVTEEQLGALSPRTQEVVKAMMSARGK